MTKAISEFIGDSQTRKCDGFVGFSWGVTQVLLADPVNLVNLAPDDQEWKKPNLGQTPPAMAFFQSYSYKSAGHGESGDVGYFDGIRGDRR